MKGSGHRQEAVEGEKYSYAQQELTSLANKKGKR